MRGRWAVLVLLAITLALATAAPTAAAWQEPTRAEIFRALLELRAEDLDGRLWTHERLKGRIVLVDFWATWCAPCLAELPHLKRARALYGDDFEVLGVSLDTLDRRALVSWLSRQAVTWPQVHERGGFDDEIPASFGIDRLPTNFLLDRHGRLRALNVRGERLFVEIERLLREDRAAG